LNPHPHLASLRRRLETPFLHGNVPDRRMEYPAVGGADWLFAIRAHPFVAEARGTDWTVLVGNV